MSIETVIEQAREFMRAEEIGGWLLYDYRGMNPIFSDTVGRVGHVTRPVWLWIPAEGEPRMLVSFVDQSRFTHLGLDTELFVNRRDMVDRLRGHLSGAERVAMEYTPQGALPRVSKVDGGTLELVRSLGVEVVASADLLQHATQRWNERQLESHLFAADALTRIVKEAFGHIGERLGAGISEYDVAEFIRDRFRESGLIAADGPAVAVNEHASDPHFDPTPHNSALIRAGDWVLIDLWARQPDEDAMYADITWTAYVGDDPTPRHRQVFDTVIGARDAALDAMRDAHAEGRAPQGWEMDKVARDYIEAAGFGSWFNHRLGHSLGREVHSNAVNLDSWETFDTRRLIPGIAVTIEPGIYIPEFGVRSEIDVFVGEDGPRATTEMQREIVLIPA